MTEQQTNVIELIEAIDSHLERVHTTSLDISFNEIADMYKSGELDINPDYQRIFRWSEGSQSRFIESLLLEMPVPPIYVVEEDDGRYSLIDGLQRISSYLHYRGVLKADHFDPPIRENDFLELSECDIVHELNGTRFHDLGTALQIRIKRAFVRVEVIRKSSDKRFKYFMFKRLNTGGIALTSQQVRNCTVRMLDPTFNDFIIKLSKKAPYQICMENLSDEQVFGSFEQELALRFFALKNDRGSFKHDVSDFLTDYMEKVSDPDHPCHQQFDYSEEETVFEKTFLVLSKCWGSSVFARPRPKDPQTLSKGFIVYHFEALTIGIVAYLDRINPDSVEQIKTIKDAILAIKGDERFIEMTTGGGKNSPGRLNERIAYVTESLGKVL